MLYFLAAFINIFWMLMGCSSFIREYSVRDEDGRITKIPVKIFLSVIFTTFALMTISTIRESYGLFAAASAINILFPHLLSYRFSRGGFFAYIRIRRRRHRD